MCLCVCVCVCVCVRACMHADMFLGETGHNNHCVSLTVDGAFPHSGLPDSEPVRDPLGLLKFDLV